MKFFSLIRSRSSVCRLASAAALLLITVSARGEVPNAIAHQGRIVVTGVNFEGDGEFKFLLFADADTDHASGNETPVWSNASTTPAAMTEPASAVTVAVTKGLYGTWLGDTSIANMAALPASVEPPSGSRLYLRVWFGDGVAPFVALAPDQAIAAVPFALSAASVTQGGVSADALADGAVTGAKIAPGAVTGGVIGDGAITSEKLAADAVTHLGTPGQTGSITPGTTLVPRDSDLTNLSGPIGLAVQGNFAYVINSGLGRLQIFDVSNPAAIIARGSNQTGLSNPRGIAIQNNLACVVDIGKKSLQIFDVSKPDEIEPLGFNQTGLLSPVALAVQGNFAYALDDGTNQLQIFDISEPNSIVAKDSDQTGISTPRDLAVHGNLVCVVDRGMNRLQLFDVTSADNIVPRGFVTIGAPRDVAIVGSIAYVVTDSVFSNRIQAFDISDPDNIEPRGFSSAGVITPSSLTVSQGKAYVYDATAKGILVFDVSDPDQIVPAGLVATGTLSTSTIGIAFSGDSLYTLSAQYGLQIWQTSTGPVIIGNAGVTGTLAASEARITGSVSAADFRFPSPRNFFYKIPGNQFVSDASLAENIGGYTTEIQGSGFVPVRLPEGARIIHFALNYYDNDAGKWLSLAANLRRTKILNTGIPVVESVLSVSTSPPDSAENTIRGSASFFSSTGPPHIVNNEEYAYSVTAEISSSVVSDELRFYGVQITYSMESLAP